MTSARRDGSSASVASASRNSTLSPSSVQAVKTSSSWSTAMTNRRSDSSSRSRRSSARGAGPGRTSTTRRLSLQGTTRLQAKLLAQELSRLAVRRQRVCLAPGAVQREHQLTAQPLLQRVRLDERLELGDDRGVVPGRQVRVDAIHEGREPELL